MIQILIEICLMLIYRSLEDWDLTEKIIHMIAIMDRHISLNPAFHNASRMLGEITLERLDTEKTINHFHGLIGKTPLFPYAWLEFHALYLVERVCSLIGQEQSFHQRRTIQIKQ